MESHQGSPSVSSLPLEVLALVLAHVAGASEAASLRSSDNTGTAAREVSGLNAWVKPLRAVCTVWRDEVNGLVNNLAIEATKRAPRRTLPMSRFRRLSSLALGAGMAAPEALLASVVGCTTLKSLTFHHHAKVYPHVGSLTTLTHLTIESLHNKASCRQLETALQQLTVLQSLCISGTLPDANPCLRVALANMPSLRSLEISTQPLGLQLCNAGSWELCTGLTSLRISQYDVCTLRGLSQLQALQHLRIELMQRGRVAKIEGVHKLPKLTCLEIIIPSAAEDAWLADQSVTDFGKCSALTRLKMIGFSHEYWEHDELCNALSSLKRLASLSMGASTPRGYWDCAETSCPESIGNLTMLTSLHLEQFTTLPRSLTKLIKLRRLSVERMAFDRGHEWDILQWANKFPNLQHLDVDIPTSNRLYSDGISIVSTFRSLNQLTSLQSLNLACSMPLDGRLEKALQQLTSLTRLSLRLSTRYRDTYYRTLNNLSQLTRLKALAISCSYKWFTSLPDDAFSALWQLQELSLADCANFEQLPHSISSLRALRKLNLDGCVSLKRIPDWVSGLWSLEELTCRIDRKWVLALEGMPWRGLMALPHLRRLVLPAGLRKFGGVSADVADAYELQYVVEWV